MKENYKLRNPLLLSRTRKHIHQAQKKGVGKKEQIKKDPAGKKKLKMKMGLLTKHQAQILSQRIHFLKLRDKPNRKAELYRRKQIG